MSIDERPCPNCASTAFVDGRCERCGRPRLEDAAYLDEVESLAWSVVNAAYDVYGDLRRPDGVPDELQRAIVALADRLRHHHYEGDGCVDEADDQDEPQASTSGLETEEPRGTDLVDYDLCWAFDLVDPWGNRYELNCYDYDRVEAELFEADAVEVDRYWPREVYEAYVEATSP